MKKQLLAVALAALACVGAQAQDTLSKVKASGAITMGVRDSSGALSYTLGDGKYAGYHYEICQRIIANAEKAVGKKLEVKFQSAVSYTHLRAHETG
jgi:glutamate/aspartate transport system substrate-binding protein